MADDKRFSRNPGEYLAYSLARGHTAAHIHQGVPLLDRDVNLLGDLAAEVARSIARNFLGDGLATTSGLEVFEELSNPSVSDFLVSGYGRCLVGGIPIDVETVQYSSHAQQHGLPALTTPGEDRVDLAYVDAWIDDASGSDPSLDNSADLQERTSSRSEARWVIRVAEGDGVPRVATDSEGRTHYHHVFAKFHRTAGVVEIRQEMIHDLRTTSVNLVELSTRIRTLVEPRLVALETTSAGHASRLGSIESRLALVEQRLDALEALSHDRFHVCKNCRAFFNAWDRSRSICPAFPEGDGHDPAGSANYDLSHTRARAGEQGGWFCCNKCRGLFFGRSDKTGLCPKSMKQGAPHEWPGHEGAGSLEYAVPFTPAIAIDLGMGGVTWCGKCEGLFTWNAEYSFSGMSLKTGVCPAGGGHERSGSGYSPRGG